MKKKITVLLLAMLFCACFLADAQQTGKIPRIGFLDLSTASGSAVLLEAFRQELTQAWLDRGKEYHHRVPVCASKSLSVYLSLRRTWFVLRLI